MLAPKIRKPVPFAFVLELLEPLDPLTRPMFGCTAVYVGEQIVLILRDRDSHIDDNGVWLATSAAHHASLKKDFPAMRSIGLLGNGPTAWQVLPVKATDFEASVQRACELIQKGDPRIGHVPKARKKKKPKTKR